MNRGSIFSSLNIMTRCAPVYYDRIFLVYSAILVFKTFVRLCLWLNFFTICSKHQFRTADVVFMISSAFAIDCLQLAVSIFNIEASPCRIFFFYLIENSSVS